MLKSAIFHSNNYKVNKTSRKVKLWKSYFHTLFNEEHNYTLNSGRLTTKVEDQNYCCNQRIQEYEVKEELKRMTAGKVVGTDDIPVEVCKRLGYKVN